MENKDDMQKEIKQPIYEPPKAVDISDSGVSGQHPECGPGFQAVADCNPGSGFGGSP